MSIIDFLHYILILVLITIPLHPLKYIRYTLYLPIIISLLWLICNGCLLTKGSSIASDNNFIHHHLKVFGLSRSFVDNLTTFYLLCVVYIAYYRLSKK